MTASRLSFGDFELHPDRFELSRKGDALRLERKPMELLILLAASQGRVVSRSEIAERLWGTEVFVDTEHGINTAVRKLRQALRDDPEQPRFVQTVTGKGYRFIGRVLQTGSSEAARSVPPVESSSTAAEEKAQVGARKDGISRGALRWGMPLWMTSLAAVVIAVLVFAAVRARHVRALRNSPGEHATSLPTPQAGSKAHEAYTHGWYLWYAGHIDASLPYFRKATELEPDYAPGWIGLSIYYGEGAIIGKLDPRASLQEQETTARKAVQLDDRSAEAHLALASAIYLHQWNWQEALAEVDRALALDPKYAEAHHVRMKILFTVNRPEEGIAEQRKAIEIDPFARPWAMAWVLYFARQYDAAEREALQRLEANPQDPNVLEVLTYIHQAKRMYKEAAETQAHWLLASGDRDGAEHVRRAFRQGGYKAISQWQIAALRKQAATAYVSPVNLALLYAQLGDKEQTLALLEEGLQQHSPVLLTVQNLSCFDFLHEDSRYRSLIGSIGLPPAY